MKYGRHKGAPHKCKESNRCDSILCVLLAAILCIVTFFKEYVRHFDLQPCGIVWVFSDRKFLNPTYQNKLSFKKTFYPNSLMLRNMDHTGCPDLNLIFWHVVMFFIWPRVVHFQKINTKYFFIYCTWFSRNNFISGATSLKKLFKKESLPRRNFQNIPIIPWFQILYSPPPHWRIQFDFYLSWPSLLRMTLYIVLSLV